MRETSKALAVKRSWWDDGGGKERKKMKVKKEEKHLENEWP